MAPASLRARLLRGAQAQAAWHAVRLLTQVGGVALLAGAWGLDLYGEWLILFAVPSYLAFSDVGLFAAAGNDMIMRVAGGDREGALAVFQAVSVAVSVLLALVTLALVPLVAFAPLTSWLHLNILNTFSVGWILIALSFDTFLIAYGSILYSGFASVGRYGDGGFALAGIGLLEFCGLAAAVLAGGSPSVVATAMLAGRLVGTVAMYLAMRRRVPWLRLGRPATIAGVLRPLIPPAFASGALTGGLALNVQGMVLLVGATLGPASVAIFSTLRTLSRVLIQILTSVFSVISPELSRAFAEHDDEGVKKLHRGGCQAAVWLAAPVLVLLAVFGGPIVKIWTSGAVQTNDALLYLFLAVAGLEALWTTSLAVMYATNRHRRLATYYLLASAAVLPIAYLLLDLWGLEGAASAIVALEVFMLVVTLRAVLPATQDTLRAWLKSLATPTLARTLIRRPSAPTVDPLV